jgi:hypothetical protein
MPAWRLLGVGLAAVLSARGGIVPEVLTLEGDISPYIDKDGRPMMEGGGSLVIEGTEAWRGPGHEAVLLDKDSDLLVFHAYDSVAGRPTLQISTLAWEDGWPRAGRLP